MTVLTENYTFKYTSTGVVLNTSSIVPFVDIEKITGLDTSPFRETTRDHEGVDGGFLDAEFEKAREIVLEGTAYVDVNSVDSYLDSIKANFAPVTTPQPLYIMGDGSVSERVVFAKSHGVKYDWATARRTGQTPIQFGLLAEDPRIYDSALLSDFLGFGATVTTGFGFNLGFSFGFGGTSGTTDGKIFTNAGNRSTPAVITITGPVTDPQIVNDTLGTTMRFSITLGSTDSLAIDLLSRTVTLNGTANRRSAGPLDANWFLLQSGNNFLRFRGASGSAPSTLTVQWRSAWR